MSNPQFGKRFFPPGLLRKPSYLTVSSTRAENSCRVFVFGESAAFGDPDSKFGFSRILESLLRERYPEIRFEFINTATVAINSHVILPIAKECESLNGDLWLVYMGNNETIGIYGTSRVLTQSTPPLPVIRAILCLKKFRVGQLLTRLSYAMSPGKATAGSWKGLEMYADQFTRQSDPQLQKVYANFRANLDDILQAGARSGAQTIVGTVAVNLRDCPPFGSLHRGNLSESDLANFTKFYDEGHSAESASDFGKAVTSYQQALAIDETFAEAQFRLGRCYLNLRKFDEARAAFKMARDQDVVRIRADSSINDIIRETAKGRAGSGVRLVDVEDEFRHSTKEGVPGTEAFYEHVHFRFAGNYLLARLFADEIENALPKRLERFAAKKGEWLSMDGCAARLGFGPFSQESALAVMIDRTSRPPFTSQAYHQGILGDLRREQQQLLPLTKRAGLNAEVNRCRAAIKSTPNEWVLHYLLGNVLTSAGEDADAQVEWQKTMELAPDFAMAYYKAALHAFAKGDLEQAEKWVTTALQLDGDTSDFHHLLGQIREVQGRVSQAISEFGKAVKISPDIPGYKADLDRLNQGKR